MTSPFTLAKTTPPVCDEVFPRERLFEVVDRKRRAPVVWIAGPPGAGKTTLLASYLTARGQNSVWYQLDKSDSDVANLFFVLGDAIANPDTGPALPQFTSEYHADTEAFAHRFFRALYEQLNPPFFLVLDNYQEISLTSTVHEIIRDAADWLPPGSNIAVVSRTDPPPAWVRLRANRRLEMIGYHDLKLTNDESLHIARLLQPSVSDDALARVHDVVEGWAAGLVLVLEQLAHESVVVSEPPSLPAKELVFDYLAGELMASFDPRLRDLLVRTAFLSEMSAEAAGALTGIPDAAEQLAKLHRGHQLISLKPGPDAVLYECHPMLREYLRARASSELDARELRDVIRRSATVLERAGNPDEAAKLLAEAGDQDGLCLLIRRHASHLLTHGRAETLEMWLDEVIGERWMREPWLIYWRGACRAQRAPRDARKLFEQARNAFAEYAPDDRAGLLRSCSAAMDAIIYELDDLALLDRWIEDVEERLEESTWPEDHELRARLSVSMLLALVFRQPHHPGLSTWAERAVSEAPAIADPFARMSALLLVSINLNYTGQFARVQTFIDHLRTLCARPDVPPLTMTTLHAVESMFYMLNADHQRCLASVEAGIDLGRQSRVHVWTYHLQSNGVAAALGAGELDKAESMLAQMAEYSPAARRLDRASFHFFAAWLAILRGDLAMAFREQKAALGLAIEVGCPFYEGLCRIGFAQVLAESGDTRRAVRELKSVRRFVKPLRNLWFAYLSLCVFAWICFSHRRPGLGLRSLTRAFEIGREQGFKHFLWWQPDMMAALCGRALEHGIEPAYTIDLIRERGLKPPAHEAGTAWPWPVEIALFGRLEVCLDGKVLSGMRGRKTLDLLRLVVASGVHGIQETEVMAALWSGKNETYQRGSLNTTLHRLRRLLRHEGAVKLEQGLLCLDTRVCWSDVRSFDLLATRIEGTLGEAPSPLDDARCRAVRRAVDEMIELYRGPLSGSESWSAIEFRQRELLARLERIVLAAARLPATGECGAWASEMLLRASDPLAGRASVMGEMLRVATARGGREALRSSFRELRVRERTGGREVREDVEVLYRTLLEKAGSGSIRS